MTDLETRLGQALDELAPSAALPDRIAARVAQRERRRRTARTGGSVLAAVAVLAGVLAVTRGDGERAVVTDPQRLTFRWEALPPAPIPTRQDAGAVWTGSEVIVWGGRDMGTTSSRDGQRADGAAYNPDTGRWRVLAPAPIGPRSEHHALWTGTEMIVWAGWRPDDDGTPSYEDGAAYDPALDRWRRIASAPPGSYGGGATWTGKEMVVIGGRFPDGNGDWSLGAAYDPATDSWRLLPDLGFKETTGAFVEWTGEMVLYWRYHQHLLFAYHPETNSWTKLASPPEEFQLIWDHPVITWTGSELLITSGTTSQTDDRAKNQAIAYDPVNERWRGAGVVLDRGFVAVIMPSGVWTGAEQVALEITGHRASVFHLDTGDWYGLPKPPDGLRQAALVATDSGDVYVFGEEANAVLRRSVLAD